MKNFSIAFFTFVIWSFFALWLYFLILPNKHTTSVRESKTASILEASTIKSSKITPIDMPEKAIQQENSKVIKNSLLVDNHVLAPPNPPSGLTARNADNNIVFVFEKGISFTKNDSDLTIPLPLIGFKNLLKDYLVQHPQKEVHIISSYSATENFVTPNIGKQRGLKIKNILIQSGIDSSRIVVKSNIEEINFSSDASFSNGIAFEFKQLDKKRIATSASTTIKIPKNITFYPTFSNTTILKTKKLQELVARVTNILNSNPSTKVTLIGHTDNAKTSEENYTLGLSYANQIKWYLTAKGAIETKKIRIKSKGETQPLKSNRTKKGSQANKRVVLEFK